MLLNTPALSPYTGKVTIMLENDTFYRITEPVYSPYPFEIPPGGVCGIEAFKVWTPLVYIGTGSMFESSIVGFFGLGRQTIACPSGNVYNITGDGSTGTFLVELNTLFYGVQGFGNVKNIRFSSFFADHNTFGTGYVFTNMPLLTFSHAGFQNGAGLPIPIITVSGNQTEGITLQGNFSDVDTGEYFLFLNPNIATGNFRGNISLNTLATPNRDFYPGSLTGSNPRINADVNINLQDSNFIAAAFVTSNTATTIIPAANTPVTININGNVNVEYIERFEISTKNSTIKITYIDTEKIFVSIKSFIEVLPAAAAQQCAFYISKNGILIEKSERKVIASNSKSETIQTTLFDRIQFGDYFNLWVENESTGADIAVLKISFEISKTGG